MVGADSILIPVMVEHENNAQVQQVYLVHLDIKEMVVYIIGSSNLFELSKDSDDDDEDSMDGADMDENIDNHNLAEDI